MTTSKKNKLEEARKLLDVARDQFDGAQVAWYEPAQPAECVTKSFYAYENGVSAAMLAVGRQRSKKHPEKAAIAKQLFEEKKLKTDVSDLLSHLNDVRKDVQYGEAGFELKSMNLEQLVADLELFLDEVEALLAEIEEA